MVNAGLAWPRRSETTLIDQVMTAVPFSAMCAYDQRVPGSSSQRIYRWRAEPDEL